MSWLNHGYVMVEDRGRTRPAHVVIAEKALGKPLPSTAVVHHHDESRANNANTNLVICEDQAYHRLLHRRARVLRFGGNPDTDAACGVCGKAKPFSDFYQRKYVGKTGLRLGTQFSCRDCFGEYDKKRKLSRNRSARPSMRGALRSIARLREKVSDI